MSTAEEKRDDRLQLLGDRQIHIPDGSAEATKTIWSYLKKFQAEKRYCSEKLSELIKDARKDGISTDNFRQAMRIDGMTPEKRKTWAESISAAALLFGYTGLTVAEDNLGDKVLRSYVDQSRRVREDRKEFGYLIRGLRDVAEHRKIDFDAMLETARIMRKEERQEQKRQDQEPGDEVHAETWFDRVDRMGTFLGAW